MTKYKIVKESKALPEGWVVGDEISATASLGIKHGTGVLDAVDKPHLNALLELGVVEEVKEWNPRELKVGDYQWKVANPIDRTVMAIKLKWSGDELDLIDRALGNCHPTKEAAEAWRDKLLADYK